MEISTTKFLKEYRALVDSLAKHKGDFTGAADFWDMSATMIRGVYKAEMLPGPKILGIMGLKPVKTIHYKYKRV